MLFEAAVALGVLTLLVVSATGWGLWTLRLFRLEMPTTDRVLVAQALGWGAMAFPLMALGFVNLLYPGPFWLVVVAGVAGAFLERETLIRSISRYLAAARGSLIPNPRILIPVLLTAATFLFTLPGALGPPSETDSLRSELAQAKVWLQHHGAAFVPNYHWNQPPLAEFLYVLGLAIGPDSLPALIHWWMGLLSALAVFVLGRRVVSEEAAALGALIYAATPTLAYSAASSKQELFLSLYGWLALYALLAWRRDRRRGWLALSGVMAGIGAAAKLMGLYTFPVLGLLVLWIQWNVGAARGSWREFPASLLIFGAAAMAVVLPWWLRNYAITGDPLWPAGAGLFSGRYVTPAMAGFLRSVKDDFGPGRSLATFAFGLWHVTQNYAVFSDPRTPTPPTFLLFLPGLIVGWRERAAAERFALAAMLAFCAGVYAFWWMQPQVPRYLYPLWAVASLVCGAAAAKLAGWNWPARLGVLAGMALTVALSLVVTFAFDRAFLPMYLGAESREAYLNRNVSYYADFRATSALVPPGGRILVLEALSLYYLDADYLMGLPPWEGVIDYDRYQTGVELLPPLRGLGITHILWINKPGHVSDLFQQLRQSGYLEEVYRNPQGRRVSSRTLGEATASEVILWRVRYPGGGGPP